MISHVLLGGALLSLGMTLLVFGSMLYNPRLWLQDYPEAVRRLVPPLSAAEKTAQRILLVPFLLLMLGGPLLSTLALRTASGGTLPFVTAYLNTFLVLNIVNLFDAVVLDLLVLTWMKPRFMYLPGTQPEQYAALHDWSMHLNNYLKGVVFCTVASLPLALVAVL